MQGNGGGGVLITRNREIDYRVDWYDVWDVGTRDSCFVVPSPPLYWCIGVTVGYRG